jgi:hypothetical protein
MQESMLKTYGSIEKQLCEIFEDGDCLGCTPAGQSTLNLEESHINRSDSGKGSDPDALAWGRKFWSPQSGLEVISKKESCAW